MAGGDEWRAASCAAMADAGIDCVDLVSGGVAGVVVNPSTTPKGKGKSGEGGIEAVLAVEVEGEEESSRYAEPEAEGTREVWRNILRSSSGLRVRVGRVERRAEGAREEARIGGWVPPGGGLIRLRSVIIVGWSQA